MLALKIIKGEYLTKNKVLTLEEEDNLTCTITLKHDVITKTVDEMMGQILTDKVNEQSKIKKYVELLLDQNEEEDEQLRAFKICLIS
jgi:DNA-binding MltR family transcriptional regulator